MIAQDEDEGSKEDEVQDDETEEQKSDLDSETLVFEADEVIFGEDLGFLHRLLNCRKVKNAFILISKPMI